MLYLCPIVFQCPQAPRMFWSGCHRLLCPRTTRNTLVALVHRRLMQGTVQRGCAHESANKVTSIILSRTSLPQFSTRTVEGIQNLREPTL